MALPGDALPGGDSVLRIPPSPGYFDLNDPGAAAFRAFLNTGQTGVYVAPKGGAPQLVVRAGSAIPGLGTVVNAEGARINNRGQIATWISMDDGRELLVVVVHRIPRHGGPPLPQAINTFRPIGAASPTEAAPVPGRSRRVRQRRRSLLRSASP